MLKINVRKFSLLGVFMAFFTYLYPVDFNFLPTDTGRILYMLGFLYVLFFKAAKISCKVYRVLLLSFLLFIVSIIATIVCSNAYDFSFSLKVIAIIFYAFGAILIVDLMKKYVKNFSIYVILEWLLYAAVLQAVLSLALFFIPSLRELYVSLVSQENELANSVLEHSTMRLIAVSKFQYANSAVMYGIALFSAITLAFCGQSKLYRHKALYTISLLLIIVAGILSARTFFLMMLVGFCYYAYLLGHQKGILQVSISVFRILMLSTVLFVALWVYLENSEYSAAYQWAFEGFINFVETGRFEMESTNSLQSMYRFPEHLKTWILGDGKMVDGEGFYMDIDVGYLRHLYYWGILGSILFYGVQYAYYRLNIKECNFWIVKQFYTIIVLWFFFYNLKESWFMDLYWILFLVASVKNRTVLNT